MQSVPPRRGEMTQDSAQGELHPSVVSPRRPNRSIDPAARSSKRAYNALSASSVGLELGISVMVGLALGIYMDRWLGTTPWLMLVWLVFGLVSGFRGVLRAVARAERAAEETSGE